MTQAQRQIRAFLAAIRRRWLAQRGACCALAGVAGLLVWLLTMVVWDNVAMLGGGRILLGWLVLLFAAVAGATVPVYRLFIRPPGAGRFALMYEARVPGVGNRLINAVQFLESGQAARDAMACAVVVENAGRLDPGTAPQAVSDRPVRYAGAALGLAAVLLLGYAMIWPAWTANALARVLHPFRPGVHLLATAPTVSPGDVEVVEGQPLAIEAVIARSPQGRLPDHVDLDVRTGQLGWASVPMAAASPDRFTHSFAAVREPIQYRVRADRCVSPVYRVKVQYRPRVEQLQLTVTRPAYAGAASRALRPNTGDVVALAGSTVDLRLTVSLPLAEGKLEMSDGAIVPLSVDRDDPRQAAGRFELLRSGYYTVHLVDKAALAGLNPPRYTLVAEPDEPPAVAIPRPGRELTLPADATVPLAIEADDDVALSRIALQVRAGGADWRNVKDWPVQEPHKRRHAVQADLALGSWGLQPGDVLLYRAVAYDNRPPAPNVGVGRTWSITVTDPAGDESLLAAQARHLLEALQRILALQRQNRAELDMDRPTAPIRSRQQQVRDLTVAVLDEQHKSLRPMQSVIEALTELADGPMLQAIQSLGRYEGSYQQRAPLKAPILKIMDQIIARLEELIGQLEQALAAAAKAQQALEKLAPAQREQVLRNIRDLLTKLREFIPEQDQVIEGTQELVRKGADLTDGDLARLEQFKGTEDKWAEVFTDSVKDISKLTEQGFADRSIANDYKEMVEQIEEASKNLTPELVTLAVPREQAGRELAESLAEEMEMWLPNSPDYIKWMMEEPLDQPEIPMVDLPDQLSDFIGDLIEEQDELNDAAEDVTSAWADSISAAGWQVSDGPISNFSAVGKTGNQLPDDHELSGRSGDGRSGRSQGQLVEDVAKGLQGRKTPTRITNDPYEQGVVKELQQMATGGATGGGKARGAGQEGLQGSSPPPLMRDVQFMRDWQQRIRQKAEKVVGQLQQLRVPSPDLERGIALMKQAEDAAADGRYADLFQTQQMVLQSLRMAGDVVAREATLHVNRAQRVAAGQRPKVLDAMDEPVPQEYEDAVRRYFLRLSESR